MGKRESIPVGIIRKYLTTFAMTLISVENLIKLGLSENLVIPYIPIIASFLAVGVDAYETQNTRILKASIFAVFLLASICVAGVAGLDYIPVIGIHIGRVAYFAIGACSLYIAYFCLTECGGNSS